MPESTSELPSDDRQLEASLRQLVAESDAQLRRHLVSRATQPLSTMRAGGSVSHGRAGWYSARESFELAAMGFSIAPLELEFPAPVACPSWHAAELDVKQGLVFRFFVRSAWVSLVPPAEATGVRVRVVFGLHAQAIAETAVALDGAAIAFTSEHEPLGSRTVDLYFAAAAPAALKLHVGCAHAGVPARLYPGSTDHRLLSAAIAKPEWLFEERPIAT
jgi:hypothetical protein